MAKVQTLFNRDISLMAGRIKSRVSLTLEDDATEDITTKALDLKGEAKAAIIAEENGILCGLFEAKEIFSGLKTSTKFNEGDKIKSGDQILLIEGEISEILKRERTALNYLQILSGIATETRKLADEVGDNKVSAMRKNHPLIAESEKRAVQVGGGLTHRMNLADSYLIKNTHIDYLAKKTGKSRELVIKAAVGMATSHREKTKKTLFVEVEVGNLEEAIAAAETDADAIMVDNCDVATFSEIAIEVRKINKNIFIEASGGITPETADQYLVSGADFVSMSHLVMRSKPLGMHLRVL